MENYEELYIDEYFLQISRELELHDSIFYYFWQLGKPKFTKQIDTACVSFDNEGNFIQFLFNPDFWISSSHIKRKFIICHEILHVLFKHGKRMIGKDPHLNNIAMDISINHTLINKFGFKKTDIKGWEYLCFVDTVFKDSTNIPNNKNFEFYYKLLEEKYEESNADNMGSLDNHSKIGNSDDNDSILEKFDEFVSNSMTDEEIEKNSELLEKELENLSNDEKEKLAGQSKGFFEYILNKKKVITKKKWETIIRKWINKHLKVSLKQEESWLTQNKRFQAIETNFIIPNENEDENLILEKHKLNVFFFLDVSGSCISLLDRFFNAANSIPKERFNIRIFTFDTNIREIDMKNKKIIVGGGTSFSIIEQYVQFLKNKEKINYPNAVFVMTDGYGNNVKPEKPENWYWFLSTNYKKFIPKTSKVFELSEFE